MAHKIFNKFKEPKFAEFSRKDLVVDIKNGVLYYKSNLGVHRISSGLATDTFGSSDITNITNFNVGDTFYNLGIRVGDSSITGDLILIGNLNTTNHITASGNISASGTITGNNLLIDGSQVDFTNLPTSDPGVAGRLFSNNIYVKISQG